MKTFRPALSHVPARPARFLGSLACMLGWVLAVASCSPANQYYLLTPEGPAPSSGGMGIGVGPVSIASYLERDNIVFQESSNHLAVSASHRWAGDLDNNIAQVLATNLGRRLHTGNVTTYPWYNDHELRYQITVDVRQLHGTADGDAFLDAAWRVYSLPDRRMVANRNWSGTEPLEVDGYNSLAAAESKLLARLATQIAESM
ncbi:PqiC family protein [Haloferula sargassicola]|uniref:PqiC family protein n=1 Tax=Haloferula sargassicola TaxID=490096 RepID=UPI00336538F4